MRFIQEIVCALVLNVSDIKEFVEDFVWCVLKNLNSNLFVFLQYVERVLNGFFGVAPLWEIMILLQKSASDENGSVLINRLLLL